MVAIMSILHLAAAAWTQAEGCFGYKVRQVQVSLF